MTRLFCHKCKKYIYLESITNFKGCNCGASLTSDTLSQVSTIENMRDELELLINRHRLEEIGSDFLIDFI